MYQVQQVVCVLRYAAVLRLVFDTAAAALLLQISSSFVFSDADLKKRLSMCMYCSSTCSTWHHAAVAVETPLLCFTSPQQRSQTNYLAC